MYPAEDVPQLGVPRALGALGVSPCPLDPDPRLLCQLLQPFGPLHLGNPGIWDWLGHTCLYVLDLLLQARHLPLRRSGGLWLSPAVAHPNRGIVLLPRDAMLEGPDLEAAHQDVLLCIDRRAQDARVVLGCALLIRGIYLPEPERVRCRGMPIESNQIAIICGGSGWWGHCGACLGRGLRPRGPEPVASVAPASSRLSCLGGFALSKVALVLVDEVLESVPHQRLVQILHCRAWISQDFGLLGLWEDVLLFLLLLIHALLRRQLSIMGGRKGVDGGIQRRR